MKLWGQKKLKELKVVPQKKGQASFFCIYFQPKILTSLEVVASVVASSSLEVDLSGAAVVASVVVSSSSSSSSSVSSVSSSSFIGSYILIQKYWVVSFVSDHIYIVGINSAIFLSDTTYYHYRKCWSIYQNWEVCETKRLKVNPLFTLKV